MAHGFPPDHWAITSGVTATFTALPFAVAIVTVPGISRAAGRSATRIGVYLNPSDARCYRMLLRPLADSVDALPLNQFPSLDDSAALGVAAAVVGDLLWKQCRLYGQSHQLGNNSHATRTADGEIDLCGNSHEPYFCHVHLLFRGNPEKQYHPGLPKLQGPPIGEAFPMKAPPGTPHSEKAPWASDAQLAAGAQAMRELLASAMAAHGGDDDVCKVNVLSSSP